MKKIIIVIPSLNYGGVEKSLINLLNVKKIDWNSYDIYIKNLSNEGVYSLPHNIHLMNNNDIENYIFSSFSKSIKGLFYNKKFFLILKRIFSAIIKYFIPYFQDQVLWKIFKNNISIVEDHFDIAIAYAEGRSTYYVADKINANKKYCWIHTDHKKAKFNLKYDEKYYKKFDRAICVSKYLEKNFSNYYSFLKCDTIYNIVPVDDIKLMSNEKIDDSLFLKDKDNIILSIGRISEEKGFDIAIKAAKKLKDDKISYKWYIIGDGNKKKKIQKMIKKYNLFDYVILLGFRKNPYYYLKNCNLYVQPSRYEGFSTTVMEAIVLSKNIVMTNVSGAEEQKELYDGISICNISANDIYKTIKSVINCKEKKFNCSDINHESISKIKNLMMME